MALAMGNGFQQFLDALLQILSQAAQLQVEKNNYDMIDYQNELRDGCLEAYTGIIQGLKAPEEDDNQITRKTSTELSVCELKVYCLQLVWRECLFQLM